MNAMISRPGRLRPFPSVCVSKDRIFDILFPTRPQRGLKVGSSTSVAKRSSSPRGPNLRRTQGPSDSRNPRVLLRHSSDRGSVEFIEAVDCWQKLVAIAQVILANLCCRIAHRFERFRDRRILGLNALIGTRHTDREQTGAKGILPKDE